jgi:hypothetical protein
MRILYAIALILASIPAAAQTDIRLTAPNRIVYPNNLNYQQLARIGTRSLLIFGSTTTDPVTGLALPLIRLQLLEGNQNVGAQRNLTDDTASRPTGIMQVVAGVDRFFVFFNDNRADRPGLYLQIVGIDGANIGTAQLFSTRPIGSRAPVLIVAGSAAQGYLVVWNDLSSPSSATYGRRIDPQGTIDGPEILLGTQYGATLQASSLPGLSVLFFPQDTSRLVHASGRLDPRPVPTPRLGGAYFIGSDTSLATIEGSSIKVYSKIFDATASTTIPFPTIPGIRNESRTISRDPSGQLQIHYLRVLDTLPGLHYAIERISITQTGPSAPQRLFDSIVKRDTLPQMTSSRIVVGGSSINRPCMQRYSVSNLVIFEATLPDRINRRFGEIGFSVDESGSFSKNALDALNACNSVAGFTLGRYPIDSVSRVVVHFGADSVLVEHRRSQISVGIPERLPNLFNRTGKIYSTWTTTADSGTMLLQNLDGTLSDTPTVVASYTARGKGIRMPEAEILVSQSLARPNDTTFRAQFGLQVGSIAGWTLAVSLDQSDRNPISFRLDDAAFDPTRNEIIALISRMSGAAVRRTSIFGVDQNGEYLWRIDSLPTTAPATGEISLIPTGEFQYIVVSGSSATRLNRENIVGNFSFGSSWTDAHYQRLLGERFLRWHLSGANRDRIEAEIYSVTGQLLHSQTFAAGTAITGDPFVVENPATRSLAFLYAGATGIRVFYQDSTFDGEFLHGAVSNATTTAVNPAGTWLDDTLQVVWEDYRSGEPDIYGTWWTPSRAASVREPAGLVGLSLAVVPNPASGPVSIVVTSRRSATATLEVVDMRGRAVAHRDITLAAGSSAYPLDLSALPAGAYMLVVDGGSEQVSTPIIVH